VNNCLAVLYALCLSAAPLLAVPAGAAPGIAAPAPVRVGGMLDIRVDGEPELSKGYTVDAAGHISLDMVGQIEVVGKTPDQIAEELRTRLKEYLKEPVVTVAVITPLQEDVLVTGAVLRQGPVRLRPGDGLLQALAAVGGLGPNADTAHATLVRQGQAQPLPLNIDLLLKGDLSKNTSLIDGDIIQVPTKEVATYQVVGEVRVPGRKPLDGATRVLDALQSSGLTPRADSSRITLMRQGQSQPIVIDLDKVLAGEASANVLVQPGDVLTVGSQMPVNVAGEVRTTGERAVRNGATLMEAILFSGGFSPNADRSAIEITHKDGTVEKSSLADVTGVVGGPVLRPGDLVMVRSSKPAFVTLFGAVRNSAPQKYESGMNITDALMVAGLQENSNWKQIRVRRSGGGAESKSLTFDLEAYLKSPQTQNLVLEPGDQIFVETRRGGSSFLHHLLELSPLANIFLLFK
jgi:polysaccharide biosynthesis/export protein